LLQWCELLPLLLLLLLLHLFSHSDAAAASQ
jgi:hypothetical protein